MTKPEGPAPEPQRKRMMRLPPNSNYPGYVGAHTEDDWCAKAGCIPMGIPATPAPSQPAAREWLDAFLGKVPPYKFLSTVNESGRDALAGVLDEYARQQTAAKDAQVESYHDVTEANRLQSLRANFCDKHREMCECSTGPCGLCRAEAAERERDSLREANARLAADLDAALKAGKE